MKKIYGYDIPLVSFLGDDLVQRFCRGPGKCAFHGKGRREACLDCYEPKDPEVTIGSVVEF